MNIQELQAKKQAWIDGRTDRELKGERVTKRLQRDVRLALKRLGPRETAQLLVDLFRANGYPTELRRHL